MNLTISGHHLEVTPALRSYVTTKLDRITRHFDQVVDVKVLLTVENRRKRSDGSAPNAIFMSKAATCLQKAPTLTCTLQWMNWSTSWIARLSATRTGCRTTTTMHPNADVSRHAPPAPKAAIFAVRRFFCVHNLHPTMNRLASILPRRTSSREC
jgi:hypothetical protein